MEQEKLNGSANQTDKENYSELIKKEQIKGSPFTAVQIENEWILTLGRYRISGPYKTLEDVQKEVLQPDWYTMMAVMYSIYDANANVAEEIKKLMNNENK